MTPTVTIFVRHAADCRSKSASSKLCQCPKSLRWFADGKQYKRAAGTRSWSEAEKAKRELLDKLEAGDKPAQPKPRKTIRKALEVFLKGKKTQGLEQCTIDKYDVELSRFLAFCESRSVFTWPDVDLPLLLEYRGTWTELYKSTYTRAFVQKRLNVFLRFAWHAGYLARIPKLDPIKITEPPTMPLTAAEYARLLYAVSRTFTKEKTIRRVRAIIQLMRWSGLAVRDASTLKTGELLQSTNGKYHVLTSRQKTGVHVMVPIPPAVANELFQVKLAFSTGEYFFWDNGGTEANAGHGASIQISRVFDTAGIVSAGGMVSHRLRDTFAVDLLEKGVPMEEVSKLLGHENMQTTEKHYAKWVKGRQDRLDKLVTEAWTK